jgi:hypothetical protein
MSTFSERKIKAAEKDLMQQMNDTELDELINSLKKRPRKNETCGLLKLPAELLNMIYEDIAADSHSKVVTPDLKDAEGKKVRPGLLGTCRQFYQEMSGVFYSAKYMRAEIFDPTGNSFAIHESRLLHAIVQGLYGCRLLGRCHYYQDTDPIEEFRRSYSRHKKSPASDFANTWFGCLTFQPSGKQEARWLQITMHVFNTDSDFYRQTVQWGSGVYIRLQGFTLLVGLSKEVRVISDVVGPREIQQV